MGCYPDKNWHRFTKNNFQTLDHLNYKQLDFLTDVKKDLLTQGVKITMSGIKQADKFFRTNNIKSVKQISKHYKGGK